MKSKNMSLEEIESEIAKLKRSADSLRAERDRDHNAKLVGKFFIDRKGMTCTKIISMLKNGELKMACFYFVDPTYLISYNTTESHKFDTKKNKEISEVEFREIIYRKMNRVFNGVIS